MTFYDTQATDEIRDTQINSCDTQPTAAIV